MTLTWEVPRVRGEYFRLEVEPGAPVFILGANGTGKSSLMHWLSLKYAKSMWISAHRRTWLESSRPDMTLAEKVRVEGFQNSRRGEPSARWKIFRDGFDQKAAIISLVEHMNAQNRACAEALHSGDLDGARRIAKEGNVLVHLNKLFSRASLPVSIEIGRDSELLARKEGSTFGVEQMSDGERTVLLLAASVLTTEPGSLLLIDEPEKHLHRSVAAPLLSGLFGCRPDCYFVIATHDVALPTANLRSTVLLLRGCAYSGDRASAWDVDELPSANLIPEELQTAILGARRTMVFIEGDRNVSVDQPMYGLVLPGISVVPMGSCNSVISAVKSMRALAFSHRLRAFGIIDRDDRDERDVKDLEQEGIFVTDCREIESIYFDPSIQRMVASRYADVLGGDVEARLKRAQAETIQEIQRNKDRLARIVADARAWRWGQHKIGHAIRHADRDEESLPISIPVQAFRRIERDAIEGRLAGQELDALIRRYPIKKSAVPDKVARAIGFLNRKDYETAVIRLLEEDAKAMSYVRKLFGGLWRALPGEYDDD